MKRTPNPPPVAAGPRRARSSTAVIAAGAVSAFVASLGALGSVPMVSAEPELLDQVLAVVGSEIVLASEVDEEVYLAGLRNRIDPTSVEQVRAYRAQVLDAMIEEKVLLAKARSEGIRVSREEVDEAVTGMISELRDRFPSEAEFEAQLEREGTTVEELRLEYRERVEQQLMVRRLVDREIRSRVTVDEAEVRAYWDEAADTIPPVPARLELRRILVSRDAGAVDAAAVDRAELVLERVKNGEDFATLASVFSEGPTASRGGDLGWFRVRDLETNLARAVEALEPGEVTPVVLTGRGAHILKLEEISGDTLHLRQIVFLRNEQAARAGARAKAESIRRRLLAGESFADLARTESDDATTRENGGYLGEVPIESLGEEYRPALEGLAPGEISAILEDAEGLSIFRVDAREGERTASFEEVRERIRGLLEQKKAQEMYVEYLAKVRRNTYVENRLEMAAAPPGSEEG